MSVTLQKPMTLAEFLAWEEWQELRYEFDGVEPVAMTGGTIAADPVIVFEVLSEGCSESDLIDKNREYRATPSIQRYVVLQQTHQAAIFFVRHADGWLSEVVSGEDASLDLPEIGIVVPLREIYANVGPR